MDLQLQVSEESILDLSNSIERFQKDLNKSRSTAFRAAGAKVLSSLAKDTKVANRYRDFTDTGEKSRSGKNKKYIVHTRYRTPIRKGKALRRSWQGDWRNQIIYAKNTRELKRRPAVIVGLRGLAAETWKAAGKRGRIRVNGTDRNATNKRIVKKTARRWVSYYAKLSGDDQYIRIQNALKYIRQAIGPSALDTAIKKGARAMEGEVNARIARSAKKQGLSA